MTKIEKLEVARLRAREKGFTLVELAIVLVIIGLIIGGVLVGQDLIKAAEIRATVSQIEQFNSAVNTFRGRYQGIPGDIRNVTNFFDTTATWLVMADGDGDRVLEVCTALDANGCDSAAPVYSTVGSIVAAAGTPSHSGEAVQFWHHLSAAELIPGYYDGLYFGADDETMASDGTTVLSSQTATSMPPSKLDRNGIGVYGAAGKNYYQIGAAGNGTDANYEYLPSLTPEEAFNLDTKMDDGRPATGSVIVRGTALVGAGLPSLPDAEIAEEDGGFAADNTITGACFDATLTTATIVADSRASGYAVLNTDIACSVRLRMN